MDHISTRHVSDNVVGFSQYGINYSSSNVQVMAFSLSTIWGAWHVDIHSACMAQTLQTWRPHVSVLDPTSGSKFSTMLLEDLKCLSFNSLADGLFASKNRIGPSVNRTSPKWHSYNHTIIWLNWSFTHTSFCMRIIGSRCISHRISCMSKQYNACPDPQTPCFSVHMRKPSQLISEF